MTIIRSFTYLAIGTIVLFIMVLCDLFCGKDL